MSTIKVEVVEIQDVLPHENADTLELTTVGGWQVAVRKGAFKSGDLAVYFEQGTVLPQETGDQIGITPYLATKTDIDGRRVLVVHRVKLRGEPSFGLVIKAEPGMQLGQDVAERYGATKFYPPRRLHDGEYEDAHPMFFKYSDIENLRSYHTVLRPGEEIVVAEKVDGTNCRVGFVDEGGEIKYMAGSKTFQRQEPAADDSRRNTYWFPLSMGTVKGLLARLHKAGHKQVILFGEVFGKGIQALDYGQTQIAFRAFDLMIDGRYVGHDTFVSLCDEHGIDRMPILYRGPYSLDKIKELSEGRSTIGGNHFREGVVVRPVIERIDTRVGRVILKYIGDSYLFKYAENDTTDA